MRAQYWSLVGAKTCSSSKLLNEFCMVYINGISCLITFLLAIVSPMIIYCHDTNSVCFQSSFGCTEVLLPEATPLAGKPVLDSEAGSRPVPICRALGGTMQGRRSCQGHALEVGGRRAAAANGDLCQFGAGGLKVDVYGASQALGRYGPSRWVAGSHGTRS